jgi:hypothetical protein
LPRRAHSVATVVELTRDARHAHGDRSDVEVEVRETVAQRRPALDLDRFRRQPFVAPVCQLVVAFELGQAP